MEAIKQYISDNKEEIAVTATLIAYSVVLYRYGVRRGMKLGVANGYMYALAQVIGGEK